MQNCAYLQEKAVFALILFILCILFIFVYFPKVRTFSVQKAQTIRRKKGANCGKMQTGALKKKGVLHISFVIFFSLQSGQSSHRERTFFCICDHKTWKKAPVATVTSPPLVQKT